MGRNPKMLSWLTDTVARIFGGGHDPVTWPIRIEHHADQEIAVDLVFDRASNMVLGIYCRNATSRGYAFGLADLFHIFRDDDEFWDISPYEQFIEFAPDGELITTANITTSWPY